MKSVMKWLLIRVAMWTASLVCMILDDLHIVDVCVYQFLGL